MKRLIGLCLLLTSALFATGEEPQHVDALVQYISALTNNPEIRLLRLSLDGSYVEICTRYGWRSSANPARSGSTGSYTMTTDGKLTTLTFTGDFPTLVFDPVTKAEVAPVGNMSLTVQWLKRDDSAVVGNASARTYSTPDHPAILGLPLTAKSGRFVLVRAVGAGLSTFGVGDGLSDPALAIHAGNTRDKAFPGDYYPMNGRTSPGQDIAARIVGAFPIADESTDCGQLYWLEPGVYTAMATSASNSKSGTILLEAYVLPYSAD